MSVEQSQSQMMVEQQKTISVLCNIVAQLQRENGELRGQICIMEAAAKAATCHAAPSTSITPAATTSESVESLKNPIGTRSEEGSPKEWMGGLENANGLLEVCNAGTFEKMAQLQRTVDELRASNDNPSSSKDEQKPPITELRFSNMERVISELTCRIREMEMSDITLRNMMVDSQKSLTELRNLLITATTLPSTSSTATTTTVPSTLSPSVPIPSMSAATTKLSTVSDKQTNGTSFSNTCSTPTVTTSLSNATTRASSPLPISTTVSAERERTLSRGLFNAAKKGNAQRICQLVAEGANIEYRGKRSSTPLHEAARNGHFDALKALVELGAPFDAKDTDQNTPLHLAILSKCERCVKELLSSGANVNTHGRGGMTPLHFAVGYSCRSIVEMLIAAGADCGAKDEDGNTPDYYTILHALLKGMI